MSPKIYLENVNLKVGSLHLKNISLDLENQALVLLTGTLSTGKSTFLKSILGEVRLNGSYSINGRISYASQEPWIFPSTIKQNIIFGELFDQKRYKEILSICDLLYDLQNFVKNDETILIDGGANLSKGQQARINLARAIYRKADIYLLDDCLSALDEEVGIKVLKRCALFLKNVIVLIVTQNPSHVNSSLENMKILSIKNGKVTFVENSLIEPSTVIPIISDNKTMDLKLKYVDVNKDFNIGCGAKETDELLDHISNNNIYYENINYGFISMETFKRYTRFYGKFFVCFLVITLFFLFEISSILSKKSIIVWVAAKEQMVSYKFHKNSTDSMTEAKYQESLNTYKKYFIVYNTTFFLYILFGVCVTILHFFAASKASIRIHELMVQKMIQAEMLFFDTHLFGNIINRFSKDIYNLDENVPHFFFQIFLFGMEVLGTLVLIAMSNWILLILVTILGIIGFAMMKYIFLPIASSLKRLESAVHSPMVGYLNASKDGLTTIRVHGNEKLLQKEFDNYQDTFSSAYFIVSLISRAFRISIDMLLFLLLLILLFYFYLGSNVTAAEVGVILATIGRLLGNIKMLNRHLIEFSAIMTSVERAFNYTEIPTENQHGIETDNWPEKGNIKFNKVSLTYPTNPYPVLKEINLEINARTKVGIIGRTGSGKSSLITALFRFYMTKGQILIDETDIKSLSLNYRSKIGIVSQTPVIFSGSVRDNLDPDHRFTDNELWRALKTTKLSIDLYDNIASLNLSTGQKRLICVACLLLSKKKIVIFDEVTSDLDVETESYICEIINAHFKDCTVIIITHKPEILRHVDKILILNKENISTVNSINNCR